MKIDSKFFGSKKVTRLILYGSFGVALVLTLLLIIYDESSFGSLRIRTFIGIFIIFYLGLSYFLLRIKYLIAVNWMLIILYATLAFTTLLIWGLNSGIGIFATAFVIILSGILLGSSSILPVALSVIFLLFIVQLIHSTGTIKPDLSSISEESSYLDVLTYATVLGIFSLIAWISNKQMEKSLIQAKRAEKLVRTQKDLIAQELEKESSTLRQVQLKEMQQLYKFATLGQSTAATLHELSNHLSMLNLDIDDLKQHSKNSKAIANAKEGVEQINLMVKEVRRKLDNYDSIERFNILSFVRKVIKDQKEKFELKNVKLSYLHKGEKTLFVKGNSLAPCKLFPSYSIMP